MNEVLKLKLNEYKNSYFENKEFKAWLRESDLWMAEYTCLRIQGIEMDKKELVDVVEGKLMTDIPLDIYGFVHKLRDVYKEMKAHLGMLESMSEPLFNKFYEMLIEGDGYRKDNPVIYKWGYIAPHFNDVRGDLSMLFKQLEKVEDPIRRALDAHTGVLTIYPYDKGTEIMACLAMFYELMRSNVPLPSFSVDDIDYNKLVAAYLKDGSADLEDMIIRSLINRIDSVMMFGAESKER